MMKGRRRMKRILACVLSLLLAIMNLSCAAIAEAEWECANCGAENLTGKFCPDCGSARPAEDWLCPNCGRTNQRKFCPDCGASRDAAQLQDTMSPPATAEPEEAQEESITSPTLDELMIPERIIDIMNAAIAMACEQVAADMDMDAAELFESCVLSDVASTPEFFSCGNGEWNIELYFYYPEEEDPEAQMEAEHWCMAVKGTDDLSTAQRSVVFSAVLTVLKQVDPELNGEVAIEMLLKRVSGSQYHGNGYCITYLENDTGDDTQMMIQRT